MEGIGGRSTEGSRAATGKGRESKNEADMEGRGGAAREERQGRGKGRVRGNTKARRSCHGRQVQSGQVGVIS